MAVDNVEQNGTLGFHKAVGSVADAQTHRTDALLVVDDRTRLLDTGNRQNGRRLNEQGAGEKGVGGYGERE